MTVLVGTGAVMLLYQVLLWLVDVEVAQYRELQDIIGPSHSC